VVAAKTAGGGGIWYPWYLVFGIRGIWYLVFGVWCLVWPGGGPKRSGKKRSTNCTLRTAPKLTLTQLINSAANLPSPPNHISNPLPYFFVFFR
jgi:hypothetical protein